LAAGDYASGPYFCVVTTMYSIATIRHSMIVADVIILPIKSNVLLLIKFSSEPFLLWHFYKYKDNGLITGIHLKNVAKVHIALLLSN